MLCFTLVDPEDAIVRSEDDFRVDPAHGGRRIDRLIKTLRPDLPYARIQRLFREKAIRLNGNPASPDRRVRVGDQVQIRPGAGLDTVPANPSIRIEVLHEDNAVLVVDKPAGLAVLPGKKQRTRTVINGLLDRFGEELRRFGEEGSFGLAHRLDLDTSGALVVARTRNSQEVLLEQFRRREIRKVYHALVAGSPPRQELTIRLPLQRVERRGLSRMQVAPGGRGLKAVTEYRILESLDRASYLEVRPVTGRTHQIRVHLAAVGAPVLGDPIYGNRSANEDARRRLGLGRMFLHASRIVFTHPESGQQLDIAAPLPADLEAVLARLREPVD